MVCTFTSDQTHFATVTSPEEHVHFLWDSETGVPIEFQFLRAEGIDPHEWHLFASDPGLITAEGNYYDIDLRITAAVHEDTPFTLKGKVTVDSERPSGGTFAAIFEGATSSWIVADGALECV